MYKLKHFYKQEGSLVTKVTENKTPTTKEQNLTLFLRKSRVRQHVTKGACNFNSTTTTHSPTEVRRVNINAATSVGVGADKALFVVRS